MDARVNTILDLEKKLHEMENQSPPKQHAVWERFDDLKKGFGEDQTAYLSNNPDLIRQRGELMELFQEILFEEYKNDFMRHPVFKQKAEAYVNSVALAAQEYGKRAKDLEKENAELKERLKQFEEKKKEDLL